MAKRTKFYAVGAGAVVIALVLFASPGGTNPITQTKYCVVTVNVQGVYNSILGANYLTNLVITPAEGSCYPFPTTLGVLDIFPTTIPWTVTATSSSGSTVQGTGSVNVPGLSVSYPFQVAPQFSLSPGTYTVAWSSPVPIGQPFGSTTQSTTFTVI